MSIAKEREKRKSYFVLKMIEVTMEIEIKSPNIKNMMKWNHLIVCKQIIKNAICLSKRYLQIIRLEILG